MFSGERWTLWCTISAGVYRPLRRHGSQRPCPSLMYEFLVLFQAKLW